ncbi:hypothetical protein ACFQ4C_08740 [Larkinella insperata]|uniref:Uncharacterized protein n=1 Tax=Larkinella insperata TaxID=332158 RepID=A0ABW3QH94_9BACT
MGSYVGLSYRREENWKSMLAIFSPVAHDWPADQVELLTDKNSLGHKCLSDGGETNFCSRAIHYFR